jgi:hypothetical protein
MSTKYEINTPTFSQSLKNSKYTYTTQNITPKIYVFELELIDKYNNNNTIRCMRTCNQGSLISFKDNIRYKKIKNFNLSIIDINYPDNIINIQNSLDHSLATNTFTKNNIHLEISYNKDKLMYFDYHIIF